MCARVADLRFEGFGTMCLSCLREAFDVAEGLAKPLAAFEGEIAPSAPCAFCGADAPLFGERHICSGCCPKLGALFAFQGQRMAISAAGDAFESKVAANAAVRAAEEFLELRPTVIDLFGRDPAPALGGSDLEHDTREGGDSEKPQ